MLHRRVPLFLFAVLFGSVVSANGERGPKSTQSFMPACAAELSAVHPVRTAELSAVHPVRANPTSPTRPRPRPPTAHTNVIPSRAVPTLREIKTAWKTQALKLLKDLYPTISDSDAMTAINEYIEPMISSFEFSKSRFPFLPNTTDNIAYGAMDSLQYSGYVNSIGSSKNNGTFHDLKRALPYLKKLGVNILYLTPFLKSPRNDHGFDVSSYKQVDEMFGGDEALDDFARNSQKHNSAQQIDLVLNHTSKKHIWAQKAIAGNPKYQKYFHILHDPPEVMSVALDARGLPMSAVYREKNERGEVIEIERRVVFPEAANPEHPHYTIEIGPNGQPMWFYHTFYPSQFDLNYSSVELLIEIIDIVLHWTKKGVSIFRLDAIPFIFKSSESDPRTIQFVKFLRLILNQVSPKTMLLVEANQPADDLKKYFGESQNVGGMTTTTGAQLAYGFSLNLSMWASVLSENAKFIVECVQSLPALPSGATWANFLRSHDEVTLEISKNPEEREIIQKLLTMGLGQHFRGNLGVSGRLASLLGQTQEQMLPARILMANAILFSQVGMPINYYGDELMAKNNDQYLRESTLSRDGLPDSRPIHRGPITIEQMSEAQAGGQSPSAQVYSGIQKLATVREQRVSLRRGSIEFLKSPKPEVLIYRRKYGNESTLVVINLSKKSLSIPLLGIIKNSHSNLLTDQKLSVKRGVLTLNPYEPLWLAE